MSPTNTFLGAAANRSKNSLNFQIRLFPSLTFIELKLCDELERKWLKRTIYCLVSSLRRVTRKHGVFLPVSTVSGKTRDSEEMRKARYYLPHAYWLITACQCLKPQKSYCSNLFTNASSFPMDLWSWSHIQSDGFLRIFSHTPYHQYSRNNVSNKQASYEILSKTLAYLENSQDSWRLSKIHFLNRKIKVNFCFIL